MLYHAAGSTIVQHNKVSRAFLLLTPPAFGCEYTPAGDEPLRYKIVNTAAMREYYP